MQGKPERFAVADELLVAPPTTVLPQQAPTKPDFAQIWIRFEFDLVMAHTFFCCRFDIAEHWRSKFPNQKWR
jgi:hypothetical protein